MTTQANLHRSDDSSTDTFRSRRPAALGIDCGSSAFEIPNPTEISEKHDEGCSVFNTEQCFFYYTHTDGIRRRVPYPPSLPIDLVKVLRVLAIGKSESLEQNYRMLSIDQTAQVLFADTSHVKDLIARKEIASTYINDIMYVEAEHLFRYYCERDRKREDAINEMIMTEEDYTED